MDAGVSAQGVAATSREPWFFGPGRDLLLGCGLVYSVVFAMLTFAGLD